MFKYLIKSSNFRGKRIVGIVFGVLSAISFVVATILCIYSCCTASGWNNSNNNWNPHMQQGMLYQVGSYIFWRQMMNIRFFIF